MVHTELCLVPPLLELVRALWNYTHTFCCFIAQGAAELNRKRIILAGSELLQDSQLLQLTLVKAIKEKCMYMWRGSAHQ